MNINFRDLENLHETGVYCILNQKNKKVYIGSTKVSFKERFKQHYDRLNANTHENKYLQNAWNKNKSDFIFRIMLVCKDNFYWEQRAFDIYKPFKKRGYNLNEIASAPPKELSKETISKRSKTFKNTITKAIEYYNKYKLNNIQLEDIPEKYIKIVMFYLNNKIWNKGLKGYNTNYPKTRNNTEEGLSKRKNAFNKLCKKIYVYTEDKKLIKEYENIHLLLSDIEFLKDYISLYRSKIHKELKIPNIYQSCRNKKTYKGLYFCFEPFN